MSSFPRRLVRRFERARPDYEPAPQPVIHHADGGYSTLRPTKGWIHFSFKRVQSERMVAALHERAAMIVDHVASRAKRPARFYGTLQPVQPPARYTRQMRRSDARRGVAAPTENEALLSELIAERPADVVVGDTIAPQPVAEKPKRVRKPKVVVHEAELVEQKPKRKSRAKPAAA